MQADGCVELVLPAKHLFSRIPVNEETIQEQGSLLLLHHPTRSQIVEFPSLGELRSLKKYFAQVMGVLSG